MSAERFHNAIPSELHGNDRVTVAYFVYYLVEEQKQPFATAAQVDQCFRDCDMKPPARTRQYLSEGTTSRPPSFVKVRVGYRLDRFKKEQLAKTLGARKDVTQTSAELRALEALFSDPDTKAFLKEAIDCFEAGANRAAIVMTWLLAIDHFINHIFTKHLAAFNAALAANPAGKIKRITTIDEFGDLKEIKLIEVARAASIISNDTRKILTDGLDTRNTAAHPSNVTVARSKTIAVIEDLVTNVIRKL